jgi:CBS domain-containing protein/anti-sigma regulatory factor (Ser/Thr protein kinase)
MLLRCSGTSEQIMSLLSLDPRQSPLVLIELIQRLKIKDVMSREVITAQKSTSLHEIKEIMRTRRISGLPILEGRRLFGLVTVEDVMEGLEQGVMNDPAEKHMSRNLVVLEEDMPLSFAVEAFEKYSFNRFPVLNEEKLLAGIITSRDITMCLLREINEEIRRMEDGMELMPVKEPSSISRRFAVFQHDFKNGGKASTLIKKLLKDQGIKGPLIRRAAVAAYEMEINLVAHSLGGELLLLLNNQKIELIARDRGPGIPDIEAAMREGFSTATEWIRSLGFGAGMGLPNIKRVSDEFALKSSPEGTEIHAKIHLKEEQDNESK